MSHRINSDSSSLPRVLHIISNLGRGGAETQLGYLTVGLQRIGWDVQIALGGVVSGSAINEKRITDAGGTIHLLPTASSRDPRTIWRLKRLIEQLRPDIVQTWLPMMDVMGGMAALVTRRPWIMSERIADRTSVDTPEMKLRRWLARRASCIVANSQSGIELWKGSGGNRTQYEVIQNALPEDEFGCVKKADLSGLSLPADTELIAYAGRFELQKNIEKLLEALALVVTRRNASALLFGRGPQEEWIRRFILQHGLSERIVVMGFVDDLWSWIKASDVFVSVSHFEGMPNAVMETMALGCPIVVSDTQQHREICDESEAILVDRMNASEIAKGIVRCLDDPKEAIERAISARNRSRGWSIKASTHRYDTVYRRLAPNVVEG